MVGSGKCRFLSAAHQTAVLDRGNKLHAGPLNFNSMPGGLHSAGPLWRGQPFILPMGTAEEACCIVVELIRRCMLFSTTTRGPDDNVPPVRWAMSATRPSPGPQGSQ